MYGLKQALQAIYRFFGIQWKAAKCVLRYVNGTFHQGLLFNEQVVPISP